MGVSYLEGGAQKGFSYKRNILNREVKDEQKLARHRVSRERKQPVLCDVI